ncbi:MAG: hypothetical protein LUD29_01040 [Clostridia bacterium]|nr:hypothetical protein [Clostridia bacterium]
MTKTKKVAAAAVAVVLAGTVAVGFTACGKNKETNSYGDGVVNMALADGATLNVAIGYNNDDTGLFYGATVGSTKTFVGNYQAYSNGAKPATQAIMDATGITLKNKYGGKSTSANLTELVSNNSWGDSVDMATSDLSVASTYAANGSVLNLADYLDYMPNFKAFLEANPIVYLSVLGYDSDADRFDTTAGANAPLYVAPYFDGMDDIEKGCLMRQDWIKAVLDDEWYDGETGDGGASDDSFYDVCYADMSSSVTDTNHRTAGTQTYAESYMGKTGSWSITSTAEGDSTGAGTVSITKNYDSAISALGEEQGSGLRTAYQAIAGDGTQYNVASGNIVDIMNAAISADISAGSGQSGYSYKATGENLANLYKEYVKVAYTVDGQEYYGTNENPVSNVFCGYSACWDVDDLTALLRIIKCSSGQVGLEKDQKTTGIFARDYTNDRLPDLISLVGELYGARGATSRYEAVYIDDEGKIHDAPQEEKFWDSLERFGGLAKEGLVDGGYAYNGSYNSSSGTYLDEMHGTNNTEGVGFMQWDYSQTQTTLEFDKNANQNLLEYGWVNTPVSIWDDGTTSDTGYSYATSTGTGSTQALTEGKYMRFTDSWRSTKTAGLVVSSSVTKSEKKLAAALTFVDFLYSNDGQITTTYAIQDTSAGHKNEGSDKTTGTWYGNEISASRLEAGASFESVCDETYQYVIKNKYSKDYVVCDGQICDKDGNPQVDENGEPLDIEEYAEKVSSYTVKEEYQDECFAFDGKLYSGTLYKGKMTPTITDELFAHFTAVAGDEKNYVEADVYSGVRGSFTNFARYILGSTLPICVKDQSFENQMTAQYAKDQATKVSVSIANGTINHCELAITDNMFYTCVPTDFPFTSLETNDMNDSTQTTLKLQTGTSYDGTKTFWSLYHWVIWFGYEGTYNQNGCTVDFTSIGSASDLIAYLEGNPSEGKKGLLETRIGNIQAAWDRALTYWDYISGTNS